VPTSRSGWRRHNDALARREPSGEEPCALVLALSDHAAVNNVQRVGISTLSELSNGEGWIAARTATAPNLSVFRNVRRQPQMGAELRRRDTNERPRMPKMTLGVKWSQVQILSARLRKCILTCDDRSFIPQEWFSLYVLGTTFPWFLTVSAALVRWSSEPRI
jgi:hypothetical protein